MRTFGLAVAGLAGLILIASGLYARYARPDLEKVPVERLIENLEKSVKEDPKNVELRYNLARTYAMAWAIKGDPVEVQKGKEKIGPWFGFEAPHVPFKPVKTDNKERMEAARQMLNRAINTYEDVVKMDPKRLPSPARLRLDSRAGRRQGSRHQGIPRTIEEGWKTEKDAKVAGLGQHFITAKGAGYLIPLLDPEKDKEEVKTLKERTAQLMKLPRPVTPIVVPLKEGLTAADLEDLNASVAFDADGSGLKKKWTWISRDAGWLVYDPKGKGEITSGLQLFGNVTFWLFWDNGYHALAALDDNRDGTLTGAELRGLAIWQDVNGNAVSDPGEVRTLTEWGITAVSCRYEQGAIPFAKAGVTFRDGTTRPTYDLILRLAR